MPSFLKAGAVLFALLVAPPAAAQTGSGATLKLTESEKAVIYQSVSGEKMATPPPPDVRATIGAQLPESVELRRLGDEVIAKVPAMRPYRYTVVGDQVIIVDPDNNRVLEVIAKP